MSRHRTTARGIVASLVLAGLVVGMQASAATGGQGVPRLIFPLVAKTDLWDNYGDPRPNGKHEGIDMENPWRAPVVAVEDGRVKYWVSSLGGCMLYLYGRSSTTYLYIHLNNDLTPKNDGKGGCRRDVSFAVPDGARVTAGQQIAWNGDSGDASGNPHLHFEVHPHDGPDVDPFPYLKRATKPLFAAKRASVFSLGLKGDLVSIGDGTATLSVDRVRRYPGGTWLFIDPRPIELGVPPGIELPPALVRLAGPGGRQLRAALPVSVFTVKATTTSAAILGAPGELLIGRVTTDR